MTNRDIFREFSGLDEDLVLKAAPEETEAIPQRKRPVIYKKLIACAASLVLVVGVLFTIGFDNVYAAVQGLFSFIPGYGIHMKEDESFYAYIPITAKTENGDIGAELLSAFYMDGSLRTTLVIDKEIHLDGVKVYRNGELCEIDLSHSSQSISSRSSMLGVWFKTDVPLVDDRFELEIDGFAERLSFSMKLCETYESLHDVGPTVIRNGIAVTATADRVGNELVIWCYETKWNNATEDKILSTGSLLRDRFPVYIETESGRIYETGRTGWRITDRLVYELCETDQKATLHIPCLLMQREEKSKLKVTLPTEYTTEKTDISANTTLGDIRIVSIERTPYEKDLAKDKIMLHFVYDNAESDKQMYNFHYEIDDAISSAQIIGSDSKTVDSLEIIVTKDTKKLEIEINDIVYHLMGEYEIELDMQ